MLRFLERYINVRKSYKEHLCSEGAIKMEYLIYLGGWEGNKRQFWKATEKQRNDEV